MFLKTDKLGFLLVCGTNVMFKKACENVEFSMLYAKNMEKCHIQHVTCPTWHFHQPFSTWRKYHLNIWMIHLECFGTLCWMELCYVLTKCPIANSLDWAFALYSANTYLSACLSGKGAFKRYWNGCWSHHLILLLWQPILYQLNHFVLISSLTSETYGNQTDKMDRWWVILH